MDQQELSADLDFAAFKRKVKSAYGLDLEAYKRPQMERRLRSNMDKCGAANFQQYFSLMQRDEKTLDDFMDRITINVSELFRNPDQFETLGTRVVPELLKMRRGLSIWSAGCSYGAEPYSLAMIMDEIAPIGRHTIHATDIDDKMLARARAGVFQEAEMRNVSASRKEKYFDITPQGYEAKDRLKRWFKFQKHSLLDSQFSKGFDLILCRNVVIYFTEEAKAGLYERFFNSLNPGGYLFVGGTERINNATQIGFETRIPFFYRKPVTN